MISESGRHLSALENDFNSGTSSRNTNAIMFCEILCSLQVDENAITPLLMTSSYPILQSLYTIVHGTMYTAIITTGMFYQIIKRL